MSRRAAPAIIRGTSPHRRNAETLARWVDSSPAPPATYDSSDGDSAACARASSSWNSIGRAGSTPDSPPV
jgi:hypothetical protein